ncbi:unnamed protein product [Urochloa humidicola]
MLGRDERRRGPASEVSVEVEVLTRSYADPHPPPRTGAAAGPPFVILLVQVVDDLRKEPAIDQLENGMITSTSMVGNNSEEFTDFTKRLTYLIRKDNVTSAEK